MGGGLTPQRTKAGDLAGDGLEGVVGAGVFVFLVDGHLPGMRELRNPDSEGGKGAGRAALLSKRSEA
nr:hypothetical protein [Methylobacterium sp. Leaf122]